MTELVQKNNKAKQKRRFLELDVLRGLAALAVVLFHYTARYEEMISPIQGGWFSFDLGYLGVDLFFIISGFVIFMTLERCKKGSDFIISRFARLYPVYWTAIIVTLIGGIIFPLKDYGVTDISVILTNFTMLQSYFYMASVDGVYWSLNVELSFYFCMFAIYKLKLLKYIDWVLLFWLGAAISLIVLSKYNIEIYYSIFNLLVMKFIALFAAGISFYRIWKRQKFNSFNITILGLSLCLIYLQGGLDIRFYSVVVFFSVFLLCIFSKMAWIRISPLIYLGKISYALYLIHQLLGYGIISYLTTKGMNFNYAVIVAIIISVIIAGLMTRFVEQNAIEFIKSSWNNYNQRKARKMNLG